MRRRPRRTRISVLLLAASLGGCGQAETPPELDFSAKTVPPELHDRFEGRTLLELLDRLEGADVPGRASIAWGLGELGSGAPKAVSAVGALLGDAHADVRLAALAALQRWGQVPDALVLPVLLATRDAVPGPARMARDVADLLPAAQVFAVLTDPDAEGAVREQARRRLVRVGKEAVPALRDLLRSADRTSVRLAVDALGDLGAAAEPAIDELLVLLSRTDGLGPAAAGALGRIGEAARAPLTRFLGKPGLDKRAHLLARLALSRIGK